MSDLAATWRAYRQWPWVVWQVWRQPGWSIWSAWYYANRRCYADWWQLARGPLWMTWAEVEQARKERDSSADAEEGAGR